MTPCVTMTPISDAKFDYSVNLGTARFFQYKVIFFLPLWLVSKQSVVPKEHFHNLSPSVLASMMIHAWISFYILHWRLQNGECFLILSFLLHLLASIFLKVLLSPSTILCLVSLEIHWFLKIQCSVIAITHLMFKLSQI